jgi:signal recognition particle subunit SRP54
MKRKAEEQAAAARREQAAQGNAFGLPAGEPGKDFELPEDFKKFMG